MQNTTTIQPWEHEGSIWKTKAAYFSWVRGQIRRSLWGRNPIKNYVKRLAAKPAPPGSRAKKVIECEFCHKDHAQSKIEVDHVVPAGSCRDWDDLGPFLRRMLDPSGGYRLLCKPCHKTHTYAEKMGVTFEQAAILKEVIRICKLPTAKQTAWMKMKGIDTTLTTNAVKRRAAISEHLNK